MQPTINIGWFDVSEDEYAQRLDFGFNPFDHEETEELTSFKTPLVTPLNHVVAEGTGGSSVTEPYICLSPVTPPTNALLVYELDGKLKRSSIEAAAKVVKLKQVVAEATPIDLPPPREPQSVNYSMEVIEKTVSAVA